MAFTYSKIANYTVGSGGVPSVSFLNIPQTYTDLFIKISCRLDTNDSFGRINFNGTTTTKLRLYGDGAGTASDTNAIVDFRINPANSTASTFSNGSLYIPNYTSSNYKSYSIDTVYENNATTAIMMLLSGLWSNTAAINSVTFLPQSGNFVQYSSFHLYGIKAEV
jgi:hypothetical protein